LDYLNLLTMAAEIKFHLARTVESWPNRW